MAHHLHQITRREIDFGTDGTLHYFSVPALEENGIGNISRLPISLRIVLSACVFR